MLQICCKQLLILLLLTVTPSVVPLKTYFLSLKCFLSWCYCAYVGKNERANLLYGYL